MSKERSGMKSENTMTTPDIEQLRKLAEAATPGEWEVLRPKKTGGALGDPGDRGLQANGIMLGELWEHAPTQGNVLGTRLNAEANAAYIAAANPQAILGLITRLEETERTLEKEERDHERSLEERDFAQDCLQQAHLRLGGDGEWTAKPGQIVQPPNTGDLHYDVPALAADVLERAESAEARVSELEQKLAAIISHVDKHYVDMSSPHNQVTFHYCAICGTNRDDVLASVPIEHATDCPIRSATPSPTQEQGR